MTSAKHRARGKFQPFQGYTLPFPNWDPCTSSICPSEAEQNSCAYSVLYTIDHIPNISFCCTSVPWMTICSLRVGLGCFGYYYNYSYSLYSSYNCSFKDSLTILLYAAYEQTTNKQMFNDNYLIPFQQNLIIIVIMLLNETLQLAHNKQYDLDIQ